MPYIQRIAITDATGYREELHDMSGENYERVSNWLDELMASGVIDGWWIDS